MNETVVESPRDETSVIQFYNTYSSFEEEISNCCKHEFSIGQELQTNKLKSLSYALICFWFQFKIFYGLNIKQVTFNQWYWMRG